MLIRCGYEMSLRCEQPTAIICRLSVHDDHKHDLTSPETFRTYPDVPASLHRDMFGNRFRRLMAPQGVLTIRGDAVVEDDGAPDPVVPGAREVAVMDLPPEALDYLTASRYCETDLLSQTAWDLFGAREPGWGRVQAICDFVHQHVRFDYAQARATRSAAETFKERVGVCRDMAHLAIALCRCLNIPARYVNGFLGDIGVPPGGPMDFSAWMEVFLDGAWYAFDPRNNASRIGRIVIARGRDAADVPMVNSFGPHTLNAFQVWTDEVKRLAAE